MHMGDQALFALSLRVHVRQFLEDQKRLHCCFLVPLKLRWGWTYSCWQKQKPPNALLTHITSVLANVLQSMANQVQTLFPSSTLFSLSLTLGCLTISFEPNFTRLFSLPYSDGFYRISKDAPYLSVPTESFGASRVAFKWPQNQHGFEYFEILYIVNLTIALYMGQQTILSWRNSVTSIRHKFDIQRK